MIPLQISCYKIFIIVFLKKVVGQSNKYLYNKKYLDFITIFWYNKGTIVLIIFEHLLKYLILKNIKKAKWGIKDERDLLNTKYIKVI